LAPGKRLIEAPTAGTSATCKSCAHCPWMAMNGLVGLRDCLAFKGTERNPFEVFVDPAMGTKAVNCIDRMLRFTAENPEKLARAQHGFVKNIGAA
jgi:quinolinate synthase